MKKTEREPIRWQYVPVAVISFLIPIVGWIICLAANWRHKELAAVCSKWSCVGFGVELMLIFLLRRFGPGLLP